MALSVYIIGSFEYRKYLWGGVSIKNNLLLYQQQTIEVRGIVSDNKGEPIPGVTIVVKGSKDRGTTTDLDGNYSLRVDSDATLVFSFVGFHTEEIAIRNRKIINVKLEEESQQLEEVVLIGYGKQEKQKVVSSIATVEGKSIELPSRGLTNNLAGRISGLLAVQRSGEPGYDNAELWIRGISSFAGGTGALVLVDGVPRNINDISPEEVETFTILKDASATAVYGAEGANGVILITSKRGKMQKTNIDVRADYILNQPTRILQFLDAPNWMRLYNEAKWNTVGNPAPSFWGLGRYQPEFTEELIAKHASGEDPDIYPNTRWTDLLKPLAQNQRLALNFRGGGDKLRFFVATSFFNEEGLFKSNPIDANEYVKEKVYDVNIGLQRYNLRTNIDMDVTETTKLKVDLSGQYLTTNYPGTGVGSIMSQIFNSAPHLIPMVYSNGYPSQYSTANGYANPYTSLNFKGYIREYRVNMQSNVGIEQRLNFITPGLYFKGSVSFDADFVAKVDREKRPNTYLATGRDANGELLLKKVMLGQNTPTEARGGAFSGGNKRIYVETSFNYNRTFGYHSVSGLLLYNQKEEQKQGIAYLYKKQNIVGRASYAFNNKYFTDISFGFTGSENFAPNHRFGFFPAIGIGYLITNEAVIGNWLQKNYINKLKLRLSYGRTGNDRISNDVNDRFPYRERLNWTNENITLGFGNGAESTGRIIYERTPFNPNIQWEIEDKRNIGFDINLFNAIDLTLDYFNNYRKNILITRNTISSITGFQKNPYQNYGEVSNWGIDASMNFKTTFDKFTLTALGTFTFARNKIIEQDEIPRKEAYQNQTGTRIGQVTAYIAERLYQDSDFNITTNPTTGVKTYTLKSGIPIPKWGAVFPGNIKYADLNGDGVIDEGDWTRTPDGVYPNRPEIAYGFGFSLDYKNFYVSTFFQGAANVSVYLSPTQMMPFSGVDPRVTSAKQFALSRWTVENPSQNVVLPRLMLENKNINDLRQSTWWLRNGNFLRFKNFEVGYRFPKETVSKMKMKAFRIYILGQNLMTWDHIKYYDPEQGGNYYNYPLQRSYNIGVDLTL
ncbi:SusC/RagA family TonB-linked outer membrane protein [Capnocytophaga catalasegens]|uniref:SusC/RagA family TonB-linked outer membrane protein n=1 Tax=Capnocytophaga catalasegens TaxID=1004260 RepID=A0AAV5AW43_9FLAO|nr:TonB-dependent receptor [Capnocytophaga catalasegens]GJM51507.1 SusC/RagA family TonB-linked outer membrane protein [Capnocytophaga catalasegens]